MKSLLLVLTLMFLASCTSLLPQRDSKVVADTCYVKWKTETNRNKYLASLGKDRKEMEINDLLMPQGENGGVYVRSKISDSLYAVIFDNSDPHVTQIVDRLNETHFAEVDPRLKSELRGSTFKIKGYELEVMLKDYETVLCQEYMATQVL